MNLFMRLVLLHLRARRATPVSLWDTIRTPFRVLPTDLDVLAHMNNGRYLSILDLGRMDLMLRSGLWPKLRERGWYPVVAGQTITYRRSLEPFQRFQVETRYLGKDDRWIYLEQTFLARGAVYAQAVIRCRFLKRTGGSVEIDELIQVAGDPPPTQLPHWIGEWTDHTRFPTGHAVQPEHTA